MMDLNDLPNELLKMVIFYLDKKDAKNLALASQRMRKLTLERLWSKVSYKEHKNLSFLKQISHFPIDELRTSDFKCEWKDIIETIPRLKRLHIDWGMNYLSWSPKILLKLQNVSLIVHTKVLNIRSDEEFDQLLEAIDACSVIELIVNHEVKKKQWSPELLRKLVGKVHISEINTTCLKFTEDNVEEFCQIISSLTNCRIRFPHEMRALDEDSEDSEDEVMLLPLERFLAYRFTIKDIETFARYNIEISFMSSSKLRFEGNPANLVQFVPALEQLRYLKCFEFQANNSKLKLDHSVLEKFVSLPIQNIKTKILNINKENIKNFVDILAKMKSLQCLHIWGLFRFKPEDLALFKDLPVKNVSLIALRLTKENVPKFRKIMNEMKIEGLGSMTTKRKSKLGIEFRQFGPGGIYWSI